MGCLAESLNPGKLRTVARRVVLIISSMSWTDENAFAKAGEKNLKIFCHNLDYFL